MMDDDERKRVTAAIDQPKYNFETITVFEALGWAVACRTTLTRTSYSIAVRYHGDDEVVDESGGDCESLALLLAEFDPAVKDMLIRDAEADIRAAEADGDQYDRAHQRLQRVRGIQPSPDYAPVPYEEGKHVWDRYDYVRSRWYLRVPQVPTWPLGGGPE